MDKQLRRLMIGWMLREDRIRRGSFASTFEELCGLVGGHGEAYLQSEFDRQIAALEHLVFPEPLRVPTNVETIPQTEAVAATRRVMDRHRESLAKLGDDERETGWVGGVDDTNTYIVGDDAGTVFHLERQVVTTSADTVGIPCTREQFEDRYPQARPCTRAQFEERYPEAK